MKPHVLPQPVLLRVIHTSWQTLWASRIGPLGLRDLAIDAQVVGKFFQELMLLELRAEDPERWRAGSPREKDFECVEDASQSFELKMCGQLGGREVFGNRCSAQGYASSSGKDRSGWLLTINYSGHVINLVRFGYISGDDWIGQRTASGNSSRLHKDAYARKLRVVRGGYQRDADARVLPRVGRRLYGAGTETVGKAADLGVQEALEYLAADYIV